MNNKKGLLLAGQGNSKKVIVAAILLGVGLAGLIDTIVFHEILQWHHMVSNKIQPNTIDTLRLNVLWDGLFLTIALVLTIVGVGLLWSAVHERDFSHQVGVYRIATFQLWFIQYYRRNY